MTPVFSAPTLVLFFFVSVLTSMISATVGMAGGTVLLSFLSLFYGYRELIPLHAASQLVSNASRTWFLRGHVQGARFYYFMLGSCVGVTIGTLLLTQVTNDTLPSLLIALYVLYELFKPKKMPVVRVSERGFLGVGALIGCLSMFVGATGLLLGVFILGQGGTKEQTIANQAAMQTFNHAAKLIGFIYLGWRMQGQAWVFLVISAGAILGTRFGVKILDKISPQVFFWIFKAVLLVAALKIIVTAVIEHT